MKHDDHLESLVRLERQGLVQRKTIHEPRDIPQFMSTSLFPEFPKSHLRSRSPRRLKDRKPQYRIPTEKEVKAVSPPKDLLVGCDIKTYQKPRFPIPPPPTQALSCANLVSQVALGFDSTIFTLP